MNEANDLDALRKRVSQLERKNRTLASIVATTLIAVMATVLGGAMQSPQPQSNQVVRTRSLIIEDAEGKPRIMLGSPITDRLQHSNTRTGMIINDAEGVERFGLGLNNAGGVVMGFDAPRGKGDDRNRERINIVADGEGGAAIRFKDRQTWIAAQLRLDNDNKVWLEFLDVQPKEFIRRRIGVSGEQNLKEPR